MTTRSWKPARMTGSCRNGAELDGGTVVHLITARSWRAASASVSMAPALCGAGPRRNSAGWEAMTEATPATCAKCLQRAADDILGAVPTVTIERGIEPPPLPTRMPFPLNQMAVGESFEVPAGQRKRVASLAQYMNRSAGRRFSVRTMPDGTVRCFRLT
jgi:hypothetical protein